MDRDEFRHLLLSGTVTFPATFPQVGSISLISELIPCDINDQKQRTQDAWLFRSFLQQK